VAPHMSRGLRAAMYMPEASRGMESRGALALPTLALTGGTWTRVAASGGSASRATAKMAALSQQARSMTMCLSGRRRSLQTTIVTTAFATTPSSHPHPRLWLRPSNADLQRNRGRTCGGEGEGKGDGVGGVAARPELRVGCGVPATPRRRRARAASPHDHPITRPPGLSPGGRTYRVRIRRVPDWCKL